MTSCLRNLVVAGVLGTSLLAFAPAPAQADDYWDRYWSWYDNTYRPYYSRYYASPRVGGYTFSYGGPGAYYYSPGYSYAPSYVPSYAPGYYSGPYGAYYGTRSFGYRDFGPYGGSVRVGPVRFGWR